MPIDTTRSVSAASPLWIIALFIALSEATTGVAAITTGGAARVIFTIFAVSFPVMVFGVFVWLLVNHAPKLYPPDQYNEKITPDIYAKAVGRSNRITVGESAIFARAVADAVVETTQLVGERSEEEKERVVNVFERSIQGSSIMVDVPIDDELRHQIYLPIDESTTVSELLNNIYFELPPSTPVFSYEQKWVLMKDGQRLSKLGSARHTRRWRQVDELDDNVDARLLAEVGIKRGDQLIVELLD